MYSNVMRMTGIFSGMDTESMVMQLMRAETMKLNSIRQARQKVEWRQQAFRNVAKTLSDFKANQLDVLKPDSIYSDRTFNSIVSSVTSGGKESNALKVSVNNSTEAGSFSLEVLEAAKAASHKGGVIDPKITAGTSLDSRLSSTAITANDTFKISLDGGASFSFSFTEGELDRIYNPVAGAGGTFADGEEVNDRIVTVMNEKLATRFGKTYINTADPDVPPVYAEGIAKVSVKLEANGALSFVSAPGYNATVSTSSDGGDLLGKLGFDSGGSTAFDTNIKMSELVSFDATGKTTLEINGKEIEVNATDTVKQFMDKVNNSSAGVKLSFDRMTSAFTLESKSTGQGSEIKDVKDSGGILGALGFTVDGGKVKGKVENGVDGANDTLGSNAEFIYNGVKYSRESNSFDVEGVRITLTEEAAGSTFDVNLTRDVTKPMEAITKFVDEYNKLIDALIGQTNTPRAKSGKYDFYEPLTDEQKEAMSEDDVKAWEEKAKTGLLYRDSVISGINSQMRQMMYTPVTLSDGSTLALYQIGITTSGASKNAGKLQIDADKLRAALENNPSGVSEMFTKAPPAGTGGSVKARNERMKEGGLGSRLIDIIDNAIGTGGSIQEKAGIEGTVSAFDNNLYDEMSRYDDKISDMLDYLEKRETYYYNMFARMEQAMNQSNNQMSSLMAMMGQ